MWRTAYGVDLLDLTTAWVCADVPEAMLVRAQAASNCKEGLRGERERKQISTRNENTGFHDNKQTKQKYVKLEKIKMASTMLKTD